MATHSGSLLLLLLLLIKSFPDAQIVQTGAIDDVHRSIGELDASKEDEIKDGKLIVEQLAKLKHELQHNRTIS